jgi:hypothetical protein
MKKLMAIFLMMSLLSVSCNKSDGGSSSNEDSKGAPIVGDTNTDSDSDNDTPPAGSTLSPLAYSFDTNITQVAFNASQEEKYNEAIEIVKMVVATEAFRDQVLNFTYAGSKAFIDNKGRTNAEIYQTILDAAETLQPAKNNTIDLEVEMYYAANSVVGYTNSGTKRIWVNTKFFDSYKANSVAGNLFHEWLHKLGYGHSSSATASRPYSVPYGIGYIMANLGKNFL